MEQQLNTQVLSVEQLFTQFWPFVLLIIIFFAAVASIMMLYRSRNQLNDWIAESRLLQRE